MIVYRGPLTMVDTDIVKKKNKKKGYFNYGAI